MRRRSGTVFLGVFVSVVAASAVIAAGFVSASGSPAAWQSWVHLPGVLDLAGPRTDGRFVVAARGRLMLLAPSGALTDFTPAYSVPQSPESYISLSPGLSVTSAGCGFGRDLVFALDLRSTPPGVSTISAAGVVSHLASVHGVSTLSGITIDTTGDFGHRLLVTGRIPNKTIVFAIDCVGTVKRVGTVDAAIEGGISVAPRNFGTYGGQLIGADEVRGNVYAISAAGRVSIVAHPDIPAGPDIGVESTGFVPAAGAGAAYVADRGTPRSGDPHPGTDHVLALNDDALSAAGVAPGDLLVATEGAGTLVKVHCARACTSAVIARGPSAAHVEGHVVIVSKRNPFLRASASPSKTTVGSGSRNIAIGVAVAVVGVAAIGAATTLVRRKRRAS
jgi:hypothetical protein